MIPRLSVVPQPSQSRAQLALDAGVSYAPPHLKLVPAITKPAATPDPAVSDALALEKRLNVLLDAHDALLWAQLLYDDGAEWSADVLEGPWSLALEAPAVLAAVDRFLDDFGPRRPDARAVPEYVEVARELRAHLERCRDPDRTTPDDIAAVRAAWDGLRQAAANARIERLGDLIDEAIAQIDRPAATNGETAEPPPLPRGLRRVTLDRVQRAYDTAIARYGKAPLDTVARIAGIARSTVQRYTPYVRR